MADDQSADDPRHDEVRSQDLSIMFKRVRRSGPDAKDGDVGW